MIRQRLIAWLASRINRHQDYVIRYLREENRILKAKRTGKRMPLTDTERRRLAVLAHLINRTDLKELSTIATAEEPSGVVSQAADDCMGWLCCGCRLIDSVFQPYGMLDHDLPRSVKKFIQRD